MIIISHEFPGCLFWGQIVPHFLDQPNSEIVGNGHKMSNLDLGSLEALMHCDLRDPAHTWGAKFLDAEMQQPRWQQTAGT